LEETNTKILESFTLIDDKIENEIIQFNRDNQEVKYEAEDIPGLETAMGVEKTEFRKVFFEDII
jgi:hypothetical protein